MFSPFVKPEETAPNTRINWDPERSNQMSVAADYLRNVLENSFGSYLHQAATSVQAPNAADAQPANISDQYQFNDQTMASANQTLAVAEASEVFDSAPSTSAALDGRSAQTARADAADAARRLVMEAQNESV
ncbi:MAG: hypothetical protein ACREGA_04755 [Candidatus Saccharimonadales bacterium]